MVRSSLVVAFWLCSFSTLARKQLNSLIKAISLSAVRVQMVIRYSNFRCFDAFTEANT